MSNGFSFQGKAGRKNKFLLLAYATQAVEKDTWREVAADEVIHSDSKPAY